MASDPEAMNAWFEGLEIQPSRFGLEVSPLPQWLYRAAGGKDRDSAFGYAARAGRSQGNSDEDGSQRPRGIAQLMRLGWFRPAHCRICLHRRCAHC